jgi:hypothetical protein
MQVQQSDSFGGIRSVRDLASSQLPSPPGDFDALDHLSPIREEALQLLTPDVHQARVLCFAIAGALALGGGRGGLAAQVGMALRRSS